jgi:two-component system copper resistance phosphate regulon response regulator CusR
MKALLVEDYTPLRIALANRLTEGGFLVSQTGDGHEAAWMIDEQEFALIILDLMLPGRSGLELLEKIRRERAETPVMLITARDAVEDRVAGLDAGADDYLVKPFALEEALARSRALVRRRFGQRDPVIQVLDLEVDTSLRIARRGGQEIDLTAKEFALLEMMALRHGEVVSRADVWEQLYDMNYERGASNVITVFISNLRKKVDRPGLPALIQTRRGEGYFLGLRDAVDEEAG